MGGLRSSGFLRHFRPSAVLPPPPSPPPPPAQTTASLPHLQLVDVLNARQQKEGLSLVKVVRVLLEASAVGILKRLNLGMDRGGGTRARDTVQLRSSPDPPRATERENGD